MVDDNQVDDGQGRYDVSHEKKKGLSGRQIVLFVILPLLLLFSGGGVAFVMGVFDGGEEAEVSAVNQAGIPQGSSAFYDMPELLINLSATKGNRTSFLKMIISLELDNELDVPAIEAVMPRIVDNFQVYLRELRVEDLHGSAGIQRLREELLLRVNASVAPVVVKDVLFQEMLVQ